MFTEYSPKTQDLMARLTAFFDEHIYPNEARHHHELAGKRRAGDPWQPLTLIEELKVLARKAGLWNMFLPHPYKGQGGISNLDYAPPARERPVARGPAPAPRRRRRATPRSPAAGSG